jgi:hypothetical protein
MRFFSKGMKKLMSIKDGNDHSNKQIPNSDNFSLDPMKDEDI